MALKDAVLDIAKDMREQAADIQSREDGIGALRMFAMMLEKVVKAAEGTEAPPPAGGFLTHGEVERRAREEARARKVQVDASLSKVDEAEELYAPAFVQCHGGPEDGTMTPRPTPPPPEGAYTNIGAAVYQFRGGGLHYSPEQTERLFGKGESKIIVPPGVT